MNYTDMYYEQVYGCYPEETMEAYNRTEQVFLYLEENLSSIAIAHFIASLSPDSKSCLSPDDLPDSLWDNSLLSKGKFYYHPEIQQRSKGPKFDPITGITQSDPYYLEMRIMFTEQDLMRYIRKSILMPVELQDDKRDLGSVKYLLEKYSKLSVISTVDFVLYLSDNSKSDNGQCFSILDIGKAEAETFKQCSEFIPELAMKKADKIVWRTHI